MYTQIINNKRIVTKLDIDVNCEMGQILKEYKFQETDYNEYSLGDIKICCSYSLNGRLTNIYIYMKEEKVCHFLYDFGKGFLIKDSDENYIIDDNDLVNNLMEKIRHYWSTK